MTRGDFIEPANAPGVPADARGARRSVGRALFFVRLKPRAAPPDGTE
jgi:hypothetical protein